MSDLINNWVVSLVDERNWEQDILKMITNFPNSRNSWRASHYTDGLSEVNSYGDSVWNFCTGHCLHSAIPGMFERSRYCRLNVEWVEGDPSSYKILQVRYPKIGKGYVKAPVGLDHYIGSTKNYTCMIYHGYDESYCMEFLHGHPNVKINYKKGKNKMQSETRFSKELSLTYYRFNT